MSERVLHCWKDLRQHIEETEGIGSEAWVNTYIEGNGTCMLEAGHKEPHEFIDDDKIGVQFVPAEDLPS